eukprot:TRINITY_DN6280_c0_g1_i1.p1 TRINITY_DN6280_c0_g1~~TRINITY_DN6280_c0_g1_i1.p1  ORF type:complete len:620 (-),score=80.16 TRINITY_DN6280_c0_g1_i1:96-1955(-)
MKYHNCYSSTLYNYSRSVGCVLVLLLLVVDGAHCFDTGHHADLLRSSLQLFDFDNKAIQIMQATNWFTDLYSFGSLNPIPNLQYLHVDTLRNTDEVLCYWSHFIENSKNATITLTKQRDYFKLITLLSLTLHAVEDFYSHSNWVETHPRTGSCDCFRTDTLFYYLGNPEWDLSELPQIFTDGCDAQCSLLEERSQPWMILHGGYCSGINKDSIVRPNFQEAYTFAFVASIEWINATKSWIMEADPSGHVWETIRTFDGKEDPIQDLTAAFRVSLWTMTGVTNMGHWKGSGSGSTLRGLFFYMMWIISPNSALVNNFKVDQVDKDIVEPFLYECVPYPSSPPRIYPVDESILGPLSMVVVRTVNMHQNLKDYSRLYGVVTVGGGEKEGDDQTFIEPTQIVGIEEPYWTTMRFINMTNKKITDTIPIRYELWQENLIHANSLVNVNSNPRPYELPYSHARPLPGTLSFLFNPTTLTMFGDINGKHSDINNTYFAHGSDGYVQLYVTAFPLSRNCSNVFYNGDIGSDTPPQCENTAPFENGLPPICTPEGEKRALAEFRNSILILTLPTGVVVLTLFFGPIIHCWRKRKACFSNERKCGCCWPWVRGGNRQVALLEDFGDDF